MEVVVNSIPQGTDNVVLAGNISKVARAVAEALCKRSVKVIMTNKQGYHLLKPNMPENAADNLLLSRTGTAKVWLIAENVDATEEFMAQKGTHFIPYSQFPPRMNWLPRRVMSAWRIAGIVHELEGWNEHESGDTVLNRESMVSCNPAWVLPSS